MAYTKVDDIQGYYLGLDFSTSDIITYAKVKKWIEEASISIDISLRRKYTLPITDASDFTFLKLLTEKMVVGKIDPILRMSDDEEEKKFMRNRNYAKESRDELEGIMNGSLQLITSPKNLVPIKLVKGTT
jgi:hypothetical protein